MTNFWHCITQIEVALDKTEAGVAELNYKIGMMYFNIIQMMTEVIVLQN